MQMNRSGLWFVASLSLLLSGCGPVVTKDNLLEHPRELLYMLKTCQSGAASAGGISCEDVMQAQDTLKERLHLATTMGQRYGEMLLQAEQKLSQLSEEYQQETASLESVKSSQSERAAIEKRLHVKQKQIESMQRLVRGYLAVLGFLSQH